MPYREADIKKPEFIAIIEEATKMWEQSCIEDFEQNGDRGSCVMGAGFFIFYIPPRCRKPIRHMVISARKVARAQGSVNWEAGYEKVLNFMKSKGLDVYYDWGYLD